MKSFVECELAQILIAEQRVSQVIVLREKGGSRALPIEIGIVEAMAIQRPLGGEESPRPLTHDLLAQVVRRLDGTIRRLCIHDLVENPEGGGTFFGQLDLERDGAELPVDCRPSDGVALAVRLGFPIFVAESLLAGE